MSNSLGLPEWTYSKATSRYSYARRDERDIGRSGVDFAGHRCHHRRRAR